MLIIVLMMTMVMLVMPWVGGGSTVERKFNDGGDDPSVVPLHPPAIDPNDVGNDHNDHLGDDDDLDYDGALFIISNGAFPAERISTDSRNLSTLRSSRYADLQSLSADWSGKYKKYKPKASHLLSWLAG